MAVDLPELLRAWRAAAGLTQADVAGALELRQQTVSDWERGAARPSVRRAPDIARLYGLEVGVVLAAIGGVEGTVTRSVAVLPGGTEIEVEPTDLGDSVEVLLRRNEDGTTDIVGVLSEGRRIDFNSTAVRLSAEDQQSLEEIIQRAIKERDES